MKGGTVKSGDESVRENIINFMEQQVDVRGDPVINNIGECRYFKSYKYATKEERDNSIIPGVDDGNIFY